MVQCEFPFKFKGKSYNGCIDFVDIKDGKKVPGDPWCSTKVKGSDREHVSGGGHYGDCNSSCPRAGTLLSSPIGSVITLQNKIVLSVKINAI